MEEICSQTGGVLLPSPFANGEYEGLDLEGTSLSYIKTVALWPD